MDDPCRVKSRLTETIGTYVLVDLKEHACNRLVVFVYKCTQIHTLYKVS